MLVCYRLAPAANRLGDPDWLGSTRCDAVRIVAGSERQAREAAALAFFGSPAAAWLQPRLVEATEAGPAPDDAAAGTVLTNRWLDAPADTLGSPGERPLASAPSPSSPTRRRSRRGGPPPPSAGSSA